MPFKTPYGDHYHTAYGCHGATEPCSTAGLAPCADCCQAAHDVLGDSGVIPGIAGVPRDAISGEMIACEFGQDYAADPEEYDNAAKFIRLMGSADARADAAKAVAVGIAERDYEQQVMGAVDLIEGEVAQRRHIEAIIRKVSADASEVVRQGWNEQETSQNAVDPDAFDHDEGPITGEGYYALATTVADKLEEAGIAPWLSQSMFEGIGYGIESETMRNVFYDACESIRFRRGILPDHLPVATDMTDAGIEALGEGMRAPEPQGGLKLDDGAQDFARIRVVNGHLEPTDYGDGFDVGDVVTYNAGWTMTLPHFAFIVRRTPKMIETIDLPTVNTSDDGYGQMGTKRPVGVIDLMEYWPRKKSRMRKSGSFDIDGHWTHPWDGSDRNFDYLD